MDIKDICSAGGDILDAVADAVNRNDYTGLSSSVTSTVNRVVSQVREEASKGTYGEPKHQYGKTTYTRQGQAGYRSIYTAEDEKYASIYKKNPFRRHPDGTHSGGMHKEHSAGSRFGHPDGAHPGSIGGTHNGHSSGRHPGAAFKNYRPAPGENVQLPAAVARRPAGRISGPLQLAWGILAASGFGITALVMIILLAAQGGTAFMVLAPVFSLLTVLGVTDIVRGSCKIGLVNRFYRYARLIGNRSYVAVEELAFQTGQHKDAVLRDLRKMLKKHMFLQGRLDHAQTTFMLTQEAYQQYLQAEHSRRDMEAQAGNAGAQGRNAAAQGGNAAAQDADHKYDAQTKKILADGSAYIRMVHECSEKIRNPQMSDKLSRLEAIMRRIFEQVEKDPSSADDLHKFMDYYLPTTTKLLNAYIDLDRQQIAGENISATKKEIEDTLDTINTAFERLLDGLFEDTAWDISSDISVMKTMMAQEGLTGKKDFNL